MTHASGAPGWRAVVSALEVHERFRSRVSVYLHPLAGRPVIWHVVSALLEVTPPPERIRVLHRADEPLALPGLSETVSIEPVEPGEERRALRAAVTPPGLAVLVDGAAALLTSATIGRLVRGAASGMAMIPSARDGAHAVALVGEGPALASSEEPFRPTGAAHVTPDAPGEALRLTDRHALSAATAILRDRLVRRHEANGVTFLLPTTVLLDVDVRIGPDTVIYPGVVLEGETVIGGECVIGPYSRLTEANIGRGVELVGWNHVVRASVRNHAVLEPYVRRGYD